MANDGTVPLPPSTDPGPSLLFSGGAAIPAPGGGVIEGAFLCDFCDDPPLAFDDPSTAKHDPFAGGGEGASYSPGTGESADGSAPVLGFGSFPGATTEDKEDSPYRR